MSDTPGEPPDRCSSDATAPEPSPVRLGSGGRLSSRLVVAGLVVILAGSVAVAQLWPKGRGLIAPGPTPLGSESPAVSQPSTTGPGLSLSPTPFRTLTFPTAPPTSEPTAPLDGVPVADWPPAVDKFVSYPAGIDGTGPTAARGSLVYVTGEARVFAADLLTGASRTTDLPLLAGELVAQVAANEDELVMVAWRPLGPPGQPGAPCGSDVGQPVAWRLLVLSLGLDGLPEPPARVLATGVATRAFTYPLGPACTGPIAPSMALIGADVAIAVDAPSASAPWASGIRIIDVSTGQATHTIRVPGVVTSLSEASGSLDGLIAWAATSGAAPASRGSAPPPATWSVGFSLVRRDGPGSSEVWSGGTTIPAAASGQGWAGPPTVAADDGIVWWGAEAQPSTANGGDGGLVLRSTFIAGDAPGATVDPAPSLARYHCDLGNTDAGQAVALCAATSPGEGGLIARIPVLIGGGAVRQLAPLDVLPRLRDGWLTWSTSIGGVPGMSGVGLRYLSP